MGNYISYFKDSIKHEDIRKAKDLLLDLHLESDKTKIAILDELAIAFDNVAYQLLDFMIRLEAKYYKSYESHSYDRLIQLITDRAHLNFDFAIIFYKIKDRKKIIKASSLLKFILTNCTDREILLETINAVGSEEIESLIPAIAEFLYYDDATLKEQAIINLVKIGSPETYKILFDISKTVKNDQNILNALESYKAMLSQKESKQTPTPEEIQTELKPESVEIVFDSKKEDDTKSEELNEFSESTVTSEVNVNFQRKDIKTIAAKSIKERFEAFSYFMKSGKEYISDLINNLKFNDHDLVVNTLKIISHTPSEEILPDIYSFLNKKHPDPSLEHEAFEALCSFDKYSFTELMMDAIEKPAFHVRISAIKALDKHYNDPVYAKVKNRIETGRDQGQVLAHTILDAHAQNLINYLLVSDAFADMASTYLTKDATPSALNNYLNILTKRGLKSTAKKIEFKADMINRLGNRLKAMIISNSDTVQKIYEKLLFNNGYLTVRFETPDEAFESISTDKPDLIVSDLFLKDMTALDFAKEVREFYNKDDLPFIVSTRQIDFLETNFADSSLFNDINGIFKFPEIIKGIKEIINKW